MSALRQRCPSGKNPPALGVELQLLSSSPVESDWQRKAEFSQANSCQATLWLLMGVRSSHRLPHAACGGRGFNCCPEG